jgi:DNA-binding beta-propeller fold protein YncE
LEVGSWKLGVERWELTESHPRLAAPNPFLYKTRSGNRHRDSSIRAGGHTVQTAMKLLSLVAAVCVSAVGAFAVGPTQSTPIALSSDDKTLVVCNPDNDSITIFDATVEPPNKIKEIKTGDEPVTVAIASNGETAYVANAGSGTVTPVDLVRRRALRAIKVGGEPRAVALTPNSSRLLVANAANNTLVVVDVQADAPEILQAVDLSPFGTSPRSIAITNDGDNDDTDETAFVAMFYAQLRPGKTATEEGQDDQREGRVVAFSTLGFTPLGAPNPITLGPIASTGFNSNGQLAPANGLTPAVASVNSQAFTTPTGAFPNQLAAIAIHPSLSRVYVIGTGASPNGPLRFNVNVQGLVSVFDPGTRLEVTAAQTDPSVRRTAPLNMNHGVNLGTTPAPRFFLSNPVAMAWRPNGSDAWVVIQNTNLLVRLNVDGAGIPSVNNPLVAGPSTLVRIDLENPGGDFAAGKAPRGLVINGAGTRAYVSNFVTRNVTVVNISNPTSPVVIATVESAKLPKAGSRDAIAQLGAELFFTGRGPETRMSSEGWGGCIVCHPGGRSDNITWMFDGGPRQTISLDGTFSKSAHGFKQRILNWSAVRDENQDFELNTRNVFGGRGLIDDDRLFYAIGGASGPPDAPVGETKIEVFNQFTGAISVNNPFITDIPPTPMPELPSDRRDFATVQLDDDRIFIIGGRSGVGTAGAGAPVEGSESVLEFNVQKNKIIPRSHAGFTPRHSLGAAAVQTSKGQRIYAIGGYESTDPSLPPSNLVQEYNPATGKWRTVEPLSTPVAQFGITVAGGINTAEPLQLIHVVSGNTTAEGFAPPVLSSVVQRFVPNPKGPGQWVPFNYPFPPRRNHGAATALRGASSRIFVIGGQNAAGTVLDTVEEYQAESVSPVSTPHTNLPAPRAKFAIGSTMTTNQIYVFGGVNGTGADQGSVIEYSIANQGPVAGPPGTPSGAWVTRGNLSIARRQLGGTSVLPVTNFLPVANFGRDSRQDAIEEWVARKVTSARGVGDTKSDPVKNGRKLFGQKGLVVPDLSCATCHGGKRWTRSLVDFKSPPSPTNSPTLKLGDESVIGTELRETSTQGPNPKQFPGVLVNVGTFTLGGGRTNEIRSNSADISQAIAPLGASGFNIPSLFSINETAPYFYSGLAPTLEQVLNGSQDGNGGTRVHFVTDAAQRADLIAFLRSIDRKTPTFP